MPETLSAETLAALPEDVRKHIEALEKSAAPAPVASTEDADRAAFEKAIGELPEGAREIVRKSQRDAAEAVAKATALDDAAKNGQFEAFAKSLSHVPHVTVEDAPRFRKMAEQNPEEWAAVSKSLIASENMLAKSAAFTEIGSGHGGAPGSAQEAIEAVAKQLSDADPTLGKAESFAKAAEKVAQENPELIAAHRTEQLRANASVGQE